MKYDLFNTGIEEVWSDQERIKELEQKLAEATTHLIFVSEALNDIKYELENRVYTVSEYEFSTIFDIRDTTDLVIKSLNQIKREKE